MKASLQLREGEKPFVRAKIPLSILGAPFISGISAGSSRELCLHLGTFWDAGPVLKCAYKPNDPMNPFAVILKTGTGEWGAPANAPITMTAEISLLGRCPSFRLNFKPRLGDFTLRQSATSSLVLGSKETSVLQNNHVSNGHFSGKTGFRANGFEPKETEDMKNGSISSLEKAHILENLKGIRVEKLLDGVTLSAHTAMPVRKNAIVKLRWGLKVPSELFDGDRSSFSLSKLPFLCLEKISLENVEQLKGGLVLPRHEAEDFSQIRGMCCSMKRHLHMLQAENRLLKKAMEDMGAELHLRGFEAFTNENSNLNKEGFLWNEGPWESSHRDGNLKKNDSRESSKKDVKKMPKSSSGNRMDGSNGDLSEELKKAIRGASGGLGDKRLQ